MHLFKTSLKNVNGLLKSLIYMQWNLSKADTYGTEVFVRFRDVSTLERFELESPQI